MPEQTNSEKEAVIVLNKKADTLGNEIAEEFSAIIIGERDFVSARIADLLHEQAAETERLQQQLATITESTSEDLRPARTVLFNLAATNPDGGGDQLETDI